MSPQLKKVVDASYDLIELIGNGSYGFVAKGKCKKTHRIIAIKIMKSETKLEYEIIKLLRELQILRQLNQISDTFFGENEHPFVPQLIDILTPQTSDPIKVDLS
jgi:serine/threonine protein kinase